MILFIDLKYDNLIWSKDFPNHPQKIVKINHEEFKVIVIDLNDNTKELTIDECEGIPITKEVLDALGFFYDTENSFWSFSEPTPYVLIQEDLPLGTAITLTTFRKDYPIDMFQHIHRLQNIARVLKIKLDVEAYFCFTNSSLPQ